MKIKFGRWLFGALITFSNLALANGLTVHGVEMGIAKFHRRDNLIHPYGPDHSWRPSILPNNVVTPDLNIVENDDHSFTVFFNTLEEFLQSVGKISSEQHQAVERLNLNAHGVPGGLWFPADNAEKESVSCRDWANALRADDEVNYDQYYAPVDEEELQSIDDMSQAGGQYDCVADLSTWQRIARQIPNLRIRFSDHAELNLLSCTVGRGPVGKTFTEGVAALLFDEGGHGQVRSIVPLGLGDWSLPEGLGFWDYLSPAQLKRDNANYARNRSDREIMQTGTIRVANSVGGEWQSNLLTNQRFLKFSGRTHETEISLTGSHVDYSASAVSGTAPPTVRIVGTTVRAGRRQN